MEGLKQATIAFAPVIVFWLFCAAASARIAHLKNIPISVGLLLGALLGLLGLVIMVCLPSHRKTARGGPPPGWYPNPAVPAHRDIGTDRLGCDFAGRE